ncbi:MAG: TonB family protein [Kangiellaceae bacterium]|jgi:uncharacterized protein
MQKSVLFMLCWFVLPIKADFFSALDAYEQGKFETAYQQFQELAVIGEKRAQFNLGVMYFQGQHVTKDINQAYAWIRLATDSETMNEVHIGALKQIEKQLTDLPAAEKLYTQLVDQYSTEVLIDSLYPKLISTNGGASFNAEPAKIVQPRYPRGAAMKNVQGWTRFSFDLDNKGVPRNIHLIEAFPPNVFEKPSIKAIYQWRFKPATDSQGNPVAQKNIQYSMQFRLAGVGSLELREGLYQEQLKLAQQGDANAQFRIGYYEKKLNVSKGKENPNAWFLKAALQGQTEAQYLLGQSLIYGQGCLQDQSKGVEWLTRAANSGQTEAKLLLASNASQINTLESQKRSVEYTKDIETLSPQVIIDQAWMYATSAFEEIRNPKLAIELVNKLPRNSFKDEITTNEIKAAAFAAMGKFKKAVSYQDDALEEADDLDADLELIKTRLASYQLKKTWF